MKIRAERTLDHSRVSAVHEAAFGRPNEARLVDLLRSSADPQLSLVAEVDDRVVGHVFFSPVTIERSPASCVAGLAPLGVDPTYQGRGVGSALVRAGIDRCPALGWNAVVLVGNSAYYARFGFVLASSVDLHYKSTALDPVFQVVGLRPGELHTIRGWVRYSEAFEGMPDPLER